MIFYFQLLFHLRLLTQDLKIIFNSDFDPWGNVKINDELPLYSKKVLPLKLGVNKKNIQSYVRFKYVDKTEQLQGKEIL